MARNSIEPARRIRIAIPGYNPEKAVRKRDERLRRVRDRNRERKGSGAPAQGVTRVERIEKVHAPAQTAVQEVHTTVLGGQSDRSDAAEREDYEEVMRLNALLAQPLEGTDEFLCDEPMEDGCQNPFL